MAEIVRRTPPAARPVQRDRLSFHQFTPDPLRYDNMPFRRCGNSGLKLSAISLGSWETFGGYRGAEVTRECIFRAFNLGITHFDLANNYGKPPGRAETFVGRVLREMPREELIISTKAGSPMWLGPTGQGSSRKHLLSSIDQSLQRMELDHVDIFYAHRFDSETPVQEVFDALEEIVRSGKARYTGLSDFPRKAVADIFRLAPKNSLAQPIAYQAPYNFLQREAEADAKAMVREHSIGWVAFSPLAQGLLSSKYLEGFPEDSRGEKVWSDEQKAALTNGLKGKLRKLNVVAVDRGQTLPQMALAWILRRPEVASVLMGASEVEQIEENVRALEKLEFSVEELRRIDEIVAE